MNPNPHASSIDAAAQARTARPCVNRRGLRFWSRAAHLLAAAVVMAVAFSWLANWTVWAELVNSFQFVLFWSLVVSWFSLWLTKAVGSACPATCDATEPVPEGTCARRRSAFRSCILLAVVAVLAAIHGWRVFSVYWPASQPPPGPTSFRVMTFNVMGTNVDDEAIMREVRAASPDILLIWELTYAMAKRLEALRDEFPYGMDRPHYYYTLGFAVYSKHPLSDQRVTWLPERMLSCPIPEMHFEIGGERIRVLGIHASNPIHGYTWEIRNRQLAALAELVQSSPVPTIVMGDFNATPWSPHIHRFLRTAGLRDTRQGQGLHNSWNSMCLWVGLPIDHIFVSPVFHVLRRQLGNPQGSDHVPVICDLSLSVGGQSSH